MSLYTCRKQGRWTIYTRVTAFPKQCAPQQNLEQEGHCNWAWSRMTLYGCRAIPGQASGPSLPPPAASDPDSPPFHLPILLSPLPFLSTPTYPSSLYIFLLLPSPPSLSFFHPAMSGLSILSLLQGCP